MKHRSAPIARWRGASVRITTTALVLGGLSLVACGGASAVSPSVSIPTPTPTAPLGPATATLSTQGDGTLTGVWTIDTTDHAISCSTPSLKGLVISVFAKSPNPADGALMTIRKGFVDVRLGSGSGKTYTERDFQGSGVSGFDATRGATLDSTLTDMTAAGTAKGTIGALSSISGAVECGNQHPGSGEITVTGDTGDGMVSGNLTSLLVKCSPSAMGPINLVLGLTHVGSAPAFVEIGGGAGTGTITLFVALQTATGSHFYSTTTPGTQSFSTGHLTYKGTATETAAAGGAPHSVAVAGNVTCGT